MDELMKFRKWAVDLGHYQTIDAVDRYLNYLDYMEEKYGNVQDREHTDTADKGGAGTE